MKWIDTSKKSHRFMVIIGIFAAVLGLWRCLSYMPRLPAEYRVLYYNHTDSLPRGLYLRVPLRELQDGDYVVFEPTEQITELAYPRGWLSPGVRFLKQVGAVAGESYEIDGLTRLDDLTEKFGIDFGESDFETINGFITDRMGHIPEDGEDFETDIDGYHFKVLKTGEKMIRLLDVSKIG